MLTFYFHIGMGKTGTSSIQAYLKDHPDVLERHGMRYIGMTMHALGKEYADIVGTRTFLGRGSVLNPEKSARDFLAHYERVAEQTGVDSFIFSNETILGSVRASGGFFEALSKISRVRFIAYIRNPYEWLPSAYAQWGLRHKTNKGRIRSFGEQARLFVDQYDRVLLWQDRFGEALDVRLFDKTGVVADFLEAVGITGETVEEVFKLRRAPKADLFLRGVFNDRFDTEVFPDHIEQVLLQRGERRAETFEELYARMFDQSAVAKIVADKAEVMDRLQKEFGLDIENRITPQKAEADKAAVREGVLDALLDITITQGLAIHRLEQRLAALEAKSS